MARPTPKKLTATTTEQNEEFSPQATSMLLKNTGGSDVLLDFDEAINADSYLLEAGEVLIMERPFFRLHYQTSTGTATMYMIKIMQ